MGSEVETYFQNMGLNAIAAAATDREGWLEDVAWFWGWHVLARLFWSKSTRGELFPRKLVMVATETEDYEGEV